MSKKAIRFSQSSGWTSRAGGSARKGATGRSKRRDLSEGSQRMADGGNDAQASEILGNERQRLDSRMAKAEERAAWKATKENLLRKFRKWKADGVLGTSVRCPLCKAGIETWNFEFHVRKHHRFGSTPCDMNHAI